MVNYIEPLNQNSLKGMVNYIEPLNQNSLKGNGKLAGGFNHR